MTQLTQEQCSILRDANAAIAIGDIVKATELMCKIPVPLGLAKAAKQAFGMEFICESGFDFSEAEKHYGQEWLSQ